MSQFNSIFSFDSTCCIQGKIATPERYDELFKLCQKDFIPRGAGSSYVLASAGNSKTSIESSHFNRILNWNPESETIEVESGMNIGQLLHFLHSKGFWFPIIPGHPTITIGGAIAFNVHGKSQYRYGLFGDHLVGLKLYHPLHGLIDCNSQLNKEVYELTIGGMGLTGFIISAEIKVQKIKGNCIKKEKIKSQNIFDTIQIMEKNKNDYEYIYAWNDFNIYNDSFGHGWVYLENVVSKPEFDDYKFSPDFNKLIHPLRNSLRDNFLQFFFLNKLSLIYKTIEYLKPSTEYLNLLNGSFPILGKEIYHRFFSRNGLLEYQLIVPWDQVNHFIPALKSLLKQYKIKLTLGSLKIFKGDRKYLHFQSDGLCIAIDGPNSPKTIELFSSIDELSILHRCIPNIAKDSRLNSTTVQNTFLKNYSEYKTKLNDWDPNKTIVSKLRENLCL